MESSRMESVEFGAAMSTFFLLIHLSYCGAENVRCVITHMCSIHDLCASFGLRFVRDFTASCRCWTVDPWNYHKATHYGVMRRIRSGRLDSVPGQRVSTGPAANGFEFQIAVHFCEWDATAQRH